MLINGRPVFKGSRQVNENGNAPPFEKASRFLIKAIPYVIASFFIQIAVFMAMLFFSDISAMWWMLCIAWGILNGAALTALIFVAMARMLSQETQLIHGKRLLHGYYYQPWRNRRRLYGGRAVSRYKLIEGDSASETAIIRRKVMLEVFVVDNSIAPTEYTFALSQNPDIKKDSAKIAFQSSVVSQLARKNEY